MAPESPSLAGSQAGGATREGTPARRRIRPWLSPLTLGPALLAIGALIWTNPGPKEFETFSGDHLAELLTKEICQGAALPLLLNLLSSDCPALLRSQQAALGSLAAGRSERLNLGLFSLYRTRLGGQRLFRQWSLPTYSVITLGVAGNFHILQTSVEPSGRPGGEQR